MALIGLSLCGTLVCWALFNSQSLAEDNTYYDKYFFFLVIIGIQVLITFPGQIAESFLEGFQKYVLKNNIAIVNMTISSTVIYSYITHSNALVLLASVTVIGIFLKYSLYFYLLSSPRHGELKFHYRDCSRSTFNEVINFGVKTLLQGIASRVAAGANNIIVAYIFGPASIVFYSIPASLSLYATNARMLLTHAFMPFFSDLHALEKTEETKFWYLSASRYVVGLVYPLCIGMILLGGDFITLWLGPEYIENGQLILTVSCIAAMFHATNPFSNRFLTAINKHGYLVKMNFLDASILIIMNFVFASFFGLQGIVFGTLLSSIVVFPMILMYTCQHLEILPRQYVHESIFPVIIPNIIMIIILNACRDILLIDNYFELMLAACCGGFIYLLFFFGLAMKKEERHSLIKRVLNN